MTKPWCIPKLFKRQTRIYVLDFPYIGCFPLLIVELFFRRTRTIPHHAKGRAIFMKGNLRCHTDLL